MSRRVLITAGASGIGLAMAQAFADLGDRVWITDVDPEALGQAPSDWHSTQCDSADEGQMTALEARIAEDWGGLDVLCANAGIKGPTAGIEAMELSEWDRCVAVNLTGAMLAGRMGARLMLPQGKGVMNFTSSTAGLEGMPFRAPYSAAKWGVIGLVKSIAMELGPRGIRSNAICPGSVSGARMDRVIEAEANAKGKTPDEIRALYVSGSALKRMADPQDIAAMAVFLASDGAKMITGQAMTVDGYTYNVDP